MEEVREHFRKIARTLHAKSDQAGSIEHNASIGSLREDIIATFLKPLLPRHFEVLCGRIIDSNGAKSSQQDCLVVDTRMPLIDVGSRDMVLAIAESVVATVEVKSYLNKAELIKSLTAADSTNSLRRRGRLHYKKGPVEFVFPEPLPIFTYIFAFDGDSPATLC